MDDTFLLINWCLSADHLEPLGSMFQVFCFQNHSMIFKTNVKMMWRYPNGTVWCCGRKTMLHYSACTGNISSKGWRWTWFCQLISNVLPTWGVARLSFSVLSGWKHQAPSLSSSQGVSVCEGLHDESNGSQLFFFFWFSQPIIILSHCAFKCSEWASELVSKWKSTRAGTLFELQL